MIGITIVRNYDISMLSCNIRVQTKQFKYRSIFQFKFPNCKLKDTDIEKCISTPTMSCERLMPTECRFEDTNTTYISSWPKQKSLRDCLHACEITTIPKCHFWMLNSANEKCDLYERDKRTCHSVGGPASLTDLYCTGVT